MSPSRKPSTENVVSCAEAEADGAVELKLQPCPSGVKENETVRMEVDSEDNLKAEGSSAPVDKASAKPNNPRVRAKRQSGKAPVKTTTQIYDGPEIEYEDCPEEFKWMLDMMLELALEEEGY
ncbi:hypothetical protein CC2G_004169 [Coprinopsis cinerea AmutBmut pab1-1]|nr:hypothetical protein CC2G_004169 [Coprinopsis cinerea AmutBmut pab1-1]